MIKQQYRVNVGEYRVSASKDSELSTIVGSCVATVMYDPVRKVAGMIHVVLPGRRSSYRENENNAYYADTGVSLLMHEMIRNGAKRENLVAGIVGGSYRYAQSVENSIGRRNIAAVKKSLDKERIPLVKQVIGNTEGWNISVDVATGVIDTKPIEMFPKMEFNLPDLKDDTGEYSWIMNKINTLKPEPEICGRLLKAVNQTNTPIEQFEQIISGDVVLTFHMMRMLNSKFYGIPGKIVSIPDAFRQIGERRFRQISVVAAALKYHGTSLDAYGIPAWEISRHCFSSALIARQLALEISKNDAEEAFSAAMLHVVGKMGISVAVSEIEGISPFSIASTFSKAKQATIGEAILDKWNIPEQIRIVACESGIDPKEDAHLSPIAKIVGTACEISRHMGFNSNDICTQGTILNNLEHIGIPRRIESLLPQLIADLRCHGLLEQNENSHIV